MIKFFTNLCRNISDAVQANVITAWEQIKQTSCFTDACVLWCLVLKAFWFWKFLELLSMENRWKCLVNRSKKKPWAFSNFKKCKQDRRIGNTLRWGLQVSKIKVRSDRICSSDAGFLPSEHFNFPVVEALDNGAYSKNSQLVPVVPHVYLQDLFTFSV